MFFHSSQRMPLSVAVINTSACSFCSGWFAKVDMGDLSSLPPQHNLGREAEKGEERALCIEGFKYCDPHPFTILPRMAY